MKNTDRFSCVANVLIHSGVGYRNDLCYGSGVVDFEDILNFEVFELHNVDILETCRKLYGLKLDLRKKAVAVQVVLDYFRSYFHTKTIYALWLSTCDAITCLYGSPNNATEITKYKLNKKTLVASDLGIDGVLFVSDNIFVIDARRTNL